MARRRSSALVTLAAVASTHVHSADAAFSLDGLFGLFSRSDSNATFFAASRTKVTKLATCVWYGSYDKRSANAAAALDALELSGRLDGEDTIRTYPTYPHAPVLVSVASCERVVLRWKSASDATWSVQAYTLERYPDTTHRNAWSTLLNTSQGIVDTYTDARVRPGTVYSYRVQAISTDNVSSAYAFDQVAIYSSACSSRALFGLVPLDLFAWSSLTNWSCEAIRTLGLLILCFLSVFALMRASVTRLQGTRARNYRLKRIHKSAAAESASAATRAAPIGVAVPARPALTDRSSSESSSTTPSSLDVVDPQVASHRSVESTSSMGTLRESFEREQSFSTPNVRPSVFERDERASACQDCRKRFGIFRRRHTCDICHAVTLCRKCGYQAPVGLTRASIIDDASAVASAAAAAGGRRSSLSASRESVHVLESEQNVKIKTICRSCCEDVYRYSTATRPSMVRPSMMLAQHLKQSMSK